ncbi:sensor domain-containing diguanylate cyclase [Rahnella sp. PCH160]|uniref:sensor domain-containing diguanylate cyclase n=1 Tax=Rahnella sp. PCH160 TaxID=3447928 RepID=UPI0039FCB60D
MLKLHNWLISIFRRKRNVYLAIIPLLLSLISLFMSGHLMYVWAQLRLEMLFTLLSLAWLILMYLFQLRDKQPAHEEDLYKGGAGSQTMDTRTRGLLEASRQVAVVTTNTQGKILSFCPRSEAIFGYTELEAQGLARFDSLLVKGQLDVTRMSSDTSERLFEQQFQRKGGDTFTGELRHAISEDAVTKQLEHLLIITDVSERQALMTSLKERKQFLKLLTQRIPNMLYQYHMLETGDSYFTYCSDGIQRLFELAPDEVMYKSYIESPIFKRILPEDLAVLRSVTIESMKHNQPWQADFRVQLPQRGLRWLRGESYAERQIDNSFMWYGSFIDITELKDSEAELRRQSLTDELTGFHNRRHCMQSLDGLVDMATRYAQQFSLIFLDLDKFKSINDQWGHDIGDLVLQQSCTCIAARLRSTDTLCRIGGEELVVLCPLTDASAALLLAQALCEKLAAFPMPKVGKMTGSFGVATWRNGEQGDVVLQRADAAAYRAKQNGRNRVEIG